MKKHISIYLRRISAIFLLMLIAIYGSACFNKELFNVKFSENVSAQSEEDNKENSTESSNNNDGHFSFIKSPQNINIFGDSMLFLYSGISLIAISVVGILFTLIPRKKRKKVKKGKK